MVLKIKDIEYEIVNCSVSLRDCENDYCMGIDVFARTNVENIDPEIREVQLYIDPFHTNVHTLDELAQKKYFWNSTVNDRLESAGTINVVEYEDITSGVVEVVRIEDREITIRWKGCGNIRWNEEFDRDVPFDMEFKTTVAFE